MPRDLANGAGRRVVPRRPASVLRSVIGKPCFMFVLGLLFSTARAHGADLCVESSGSSGCYSTISAAIAAAAAGDTILISSGTYSETLTVPAGLDGLTVAGASVSQVLLDGAGLGGAGITISADSVTLKAFTIRNSDAAGVSIAATATGTLLTKVAVRGSASSCVAIAAGAERTTIEKSSLSACYGSGVDADDGSSAVDALTVRRTTIERTRASAIDVRGGDATIESNRLSVGAQAAVTIDGADAAVRRNSIRTFRSDGIRVTGADMTIDHNLVRSFGGAGIDVTCTGCQRGVVANNVVSDGTSGDSGFVVDADSGGLSVVSNRALRTGASGYSVGTGTGITLRGNAAIDTGRGYGVAGFEVHGSSHLLFGNLATNCPGDGFSIAGTSQQLVGNVAMDNRGNGFEISATDATLTDNRSFDNGINGFSVRASASAATLRDDRSANNRTTFCDDGAGTIDAGGNSFALPGAACLLF